jgi:hypothetical protein
MRDCPASMRASSRSACDAAPGRPHALEKWSAEKARVLATGFIRVLVKRPLTRIVSAWAGTGIRIAGGNWCGHGMKPMSAAGVCVSTIRRQLMVRLTKKLTAMLSSQERLP